MSKFRFNETFPKTGKPIVEKGFLASWINEKLKNREWEHYDRVSEVKYFLSFIPLFNKTIMNRKKLAKDVGLSYDVLRKFLTENKIKNITDSHFNDFSSEFFVELLARYKEDISLTGKKKKVAAEKYLELFKEAATLFSYSLLAQITESIIVYRESALKDKNAPYGEEADVMALDVSYENFLTIWAAKINKMDKNLYLKIRMMALTNSLSRLSGTLDLSKVLFEKGELTLSMIEASCSYAKKNYENVQEILEEMVKKRR